MTIRLFRTTARIGRRTKSAVKPRADAAGVGPRRHGSGLRRRGARPRGRRPAPRSRRRPRSGRARRRAASARPCVTTMAPGREVGVDQHRVVVALDDAHRHLRRLAVARRSRRRRRRRSTGSPAGRPPGRPRRGSASRSRTPCRRAAGPRRLSRLARTRSVRVSGAIRLSSVTTSPSSASSGRPSGRADTGAPTLHLADEALRHPEVDEDVRAVVEVVISVAVATWSPTSTPRMPTQPSKGARITRCSSASSASRSASSPWLTASCAERSCTSVVAPERTRSSVRASVARASSSVSRARSSAISSASESSRTRAMPSRHLVAGGRPRSLATRPAT